MEVWFRWLSLSQTRWKSQVPNAVQFFQGKTLSLLGTKISSLPQKWRHIWVDDFSPFPVWCLKHVCHLFWGWKSKIPSVGPCATKAGVERPLGRRSQADGGCACLGPGNSTRGVFPRDGKRGKKTGKGVGPETTKRRYLYQQKKLTYIQYMCIYIWLLEFGGNSRNTTWRLFCCACRTCKSLAWAELWEF